jgi:hypothetical protein
MIDICVHHGDLEKLRSTWLDRLIDAIVARRRGSTAGRTPS